MEELLKFNDIDMEGIDGLLDDLGEIGFTDFVCMNVKGGMETLDRGMFGYIDGEYVVDRSFPVINITYKIFPDSTNKVPEKDSHPNDLQFFRIQLFGSFLNNKYQRKNLTEESLWVEEGVRKGMRYFLESKKEEDIWRGPNYADMEILSAVLTKGMKKRYFDCMEIDEKLQYTNPERRATTIVTFYAMSGKDRIELGQSRTHIMCGTEF